MGRLMAGGIVDVYFDSSFPTLTVERKRGLPNHPSPLEGPIRVRCHMRSGVEVRPSAQVCCRSRKLLMSWTVERAGAFNRHWAPKGACPGGLNGLAGHSVAGDPTCRLRAWFYQGHHLVCHRPRLSGARLEGHPSHEGCSSHVNVSALALTVPAPPGRSGVRRACRGL